MNRLTIPEYKKISSLPLNPGPIDHWKRLAHSMAAPVSTLVARAWLDRRIRNKISLLKNNQPNLRIGETHCHSKFSDGNVAVQEILHRAAFLGLDFLVLTEHLTPGKYPLEWTLASFQEQWRCIHQWELETYDPIKVYPAFELSTLQGHLIVILDEELMNPKKVGELMLRFSPLNQVIETMESAAGMANSLGGISIIAHPNISRRYPFGAPLDFIRNHLTGLVHGIEDVSTGHGFAENYSQDLGMASIGSTDDHFNLLIGTTVTGFDSTRHKDFLSAVRVRETQAIKIEDALDPFLNLARKIL